MDLLKLSLKSIKNLYKNPIIYIPDLFMYFITLILAVFFYKTSKLDQLLYAFLLEGANHFLILQEFLATYWFNLLISIIIFMILTFCVGVGIDILRFMMIKKIILRKKFSFLKLIFSWKGYFFKIVFLKIYVYLLSLILIITSTMIVVVNKQFSNSFAGILFKLLIMFIGISLILFIRIGIMYRFASLFLRKIKKSRKALMDSFKIFLKDPFSVFFLWFYIGICGFIISLIVGGFSFLSTTINNMGSSPSFLLGTSIIFSLLIYFIKLTYDLWSYFLIFETYPIKKKS